MSKRMLDFGEFYITSFYGGKERGICIQFTLDCCMKGYKQFAKKEVRKIHRILGMWLNKEIGQ